MIRKFALAAAACAFVPAAAFATDAAKTAPAAPSNASAAKSVLSEAASQKEARQHLARQGYVNISTLERDDSGRWTGTATKDGKTTFVAIAVPRRNTEATN